MIDVETYAAAKKYADEHGGGGGTTNYNALDNKPQIAGTTLQGNKSLADLGIASENDIEDVYAVMGEMGAKNLIPYPYNEGTETDRGITWTDNGDGTVTASGTATADSAHNLTLRTNQGTLFLKNGEYTLSGCPGGGSNSTYYAEAIITKNGSATRLGIDSGNGVNITINGDDYRADGAYVGVRLIAKNGYAISTPITFKPMLRLASDTDDTYQQYAKTNKQLTDEIANKVDKVEGKGLSTNDYDNTEKEKVADNAEAIEAINENGCCNILPNNATSQEYRGITYTVNSDGSISISGTADLESHIDIVTGLRLKTGRYTIYKAGDDSEMISPSNYNYSYFVQIGGNSYDITNEDVTVDINDSDNITFSLYVGVGQTVSKTVYPMLYDARLKPTGYVPYAMTNRELTERVTGYEVSVTAASGYTITDNYLKVINGVLVGHLSLLGNSSLPNMQWETVATTTLHPSNTISVPLYSQADGVSGGVMQILANGNINVFQAYYDPSNSVSKRGCSGTFSNPI